jgi:hypothetical protein
MVSQILLFYVVFAKENFIRHHFLCDPRQFFTSGYFSFPFASLFKVSYQIYSFHGKDDPGPKEYANRFHHSEKYEYQKLALASPSSSSISIRDVY